MSRMHSRRKIAKIYVGKEEMSSVAAAEKIRLTEYESFSSVNYSEEFAHFLAANVFQLICLSFNEIQGVPNKMEIYHAMCDNLYGIKISGGCERSYTFFMRDYSMLESLGIPVPTHRSGDPSLSVTTNEKYLSVVMMRISNIAHTSDFKFQYLRDGIGPLLRKY